VLASGGVQPPQRIVALVAAALAGVAGVGAVAVVVPAASSPKQMFLVVARDNGLFFVGPAGRQTAVARTRGARAPAWAPNGREIAFERNGVVYVANRQGGGRRAVLPGSDPDWSPDGRFVVVSRGGVIVRARRNGRAARRLTSGPGDAQPAWSRDGRSIAFSRNGVVMVVRASGGPPSAVANGTEPAWSPDSSRLAFATPGGIASVTLADGQVRQHTLDPAHRAPSFSLDGSELVFAAPDGRLHAVAVAGGDPRPLTNGTAAEWALVPSRGELLPDLDQRAPSGLVVAYDGRRYRLGFMSEVDNIGAGPVWVRGIRNGRDMHAFQLVRTTGGGMETHPDAGTLRYTASPTHSHWHLLKFVRYELRRASDFTLVTRDRKTGFCLADHYGHARGVRPVAPVFLGNCGAGNRTLRSVEQGSSRGYTDRYYPHIHGQDVDITRVPSGIYFLVHRANPEMLLRERRYDNNAASVRIRLTRQPGAVPTVRVLRTCQTRERC
jgi:Lysyl oxidase/WD40-like Beta Propeller Repeat